MIPPIQRQLDVSLISNTADASNTDNYVVHYLTTPTENNYDELTGWTFSQMTTYAGTAKSFGINSFLSSNGV